jgi:hypothetical protein
MMFFVHILALLYGLIGLVVAKVRTSTFYDLAPRSILEKVATYYPESVYKPWKEGTTEFLPDLTRSYVISGGIAAYALYYLKSKHRG